MISEFSSRFGIVKVILSIIDIIVLSVLLYICTRFILGTMKKRSGRLFIGIFAVIVLVLISYLLNLNATFFVLENVMQFGIIALVVIFQPELRSLLENVSYAGKNFKFKNLTIEQDEQMNKIDSICRAVKTMSQERVGALIVFQGEKELNSYDEQKSVKLNCDISKEIIENIFFKNSPLHDGAVVIRDFKISRARVLFDEISRSTELATHLGSRHKAAVGATENGNDCFSVIVSEESGQISFAIDGNLKQNISNDMLRSLLITNLISSKRQAEKTQKNKNKNSK